MSVPVPKLDLAKLIECINEKEYENLCEAIKCEERGTPEKRRMYFTYFASVAGTPENLQGILLIKKPLRYFFEYLVCRDALDKETLVYLDYFFNYFEKNVGKKQPYKTKPARKLTKYPIYGLHYKAILPEKEGGLTYGYHWYCYPFIDYLLWLSGQGNEDFFYRMGLLLRILVKKLSPGEEGPPEGSMPDLTTDEVAEALEEYSRWERRLKGCTIDDHRGKWNTFCDGKSEDSIPKGEQIRIEKGRRKKKRPRSASKHLRDLPLKASFDLTPMGIAISSVRAPRRRVASSRSKGLELGRSPVPHHSEKSVPSIYFRKTFFKNLVGFCEREKRWAEVSLPFFLILSEMGVRPHELMEAVMSREKPRDARLHYHPDGYFSYLIPKKFIPKGGIAILPLSPAALFYLNRYLEKRGFKERDTLFRNFEDGKILSLELLDEWSYEASRKLPPHVWLKPEFIANGFYPIYTRGYGLHPVHAMYFTLRKKPDFATMVNYLRVDGRFLLEDYMRASREALKTYEREGLTLKTAAPEMPDDVSFGPRVPESAELREAFKETLVSLKRMSRFGGRDHHNAYVIYAIYALLATTGRRASRLYEVEAEDFDFEKMTVWVKDKEIYPEASRLLVLAEATSFLLKELIYAPLRKRKNPLCLIGPDGKDIDPTPSAIDGEVERLSLPFPSCEKIRHFHCTYLYRGRVDPKAAGISLGHEVKGRYHLGMTSFADFPRLFEMMREMGGKIEREHAIKETPYRL